ncbi:MAG: hypothetical protein GX868_09265 [Actinobacteria bacterium]|nr:hypothetical protein [Actinomycetota bacterium]
MTESAVTAGENNTNNTNNKEKTMALIGADVEALEALAKNIQTKAEQVGQISSELNSAVKGVQWIGKDAETFKGQWDVVTKSLTGLQEQLRAHSQNIKTNADQQRTTSAS